jgi:hypothetical protein
MNFSRADYIDLFGRGFAPSVVFYRRGPSVRGRVRPEEMSPKNTYHHQICVRIVRTGFPLNGFVQIRDGEMDSWLREDYVPLGARVCPNDSNRNHIKVRRLPDPARKNWLLINGTPYELSRNQLVALLNYDRANQMVYVGFALSDGTPAQGWVRAVNLRPAN